MKGFFVGDRVIVYEYYSTYDNEYGTVLGINKECGFLEIQLDNDTSYHAIFGCKGISWDFLEEEELEQYEDIIKEAVKQHDDNKIKDFIKKMDVPNVLTKMDYQKLLDAALDRGEFSEAFRLSKKMENLRGN